MQIEDDKVVEGKDLDPATIVEINKYKETVVKRLNNFLENLPSGIVLKNPDTGRLFKIEVIKHHLYRITPIQDAAVKNLIIDADPGSEAIEINRSGKSLDEYLGLTDPNSYGGSAEVMVDITKIRILGSFESFKIRMDGIVDEIINSLPFTEGN